MIDGAAKIVRVLSPVYLLVLSTVPLFAQKQSVLEYLPDMASLDGWEVMGEPQTAEGEDLFLLINGGAEIYNEYGFSRAVFHSYVHGPASVNLEIYEMKDAASAYGAYSFKTGRDGESIDIGTEARFEEYYLNFWKGNLVVTLVGFDTEPETREAILTLANLVDARITGESARPELVDILPPTTIGGAPVHATYVEGNLALLNRYRFGSGNVFQAERGVVGDYGEKLVVLFHYENEEQTFERVAAASEQMEAGGLFTETEADEMGFSGRDRDGRFLLMRPVGRYLVVCVDADRPDAFTFLEEIAGRLAMRAEGQRP